MNVVFLDIDGVLNSHAFSSIAQSNGINAECVACLNRILRETGAKIVVSSAWRYMVLGKAMTLTGFEYLLRTHGVKAESVIDITVGDEAIPFRGAQVTEWLSRNKEVRSYVILDDLPAAEFSEHAEWLVTTDGAIGLTTTHADQAIEILTHKTVV